MGAERISSGNLDTTRQLGSPHIRAPATLSASFRVECWRSLALPELARWVAVSGPCVLPPCDCGLACKRSRLALVMLCRPCEVLPPE